jgi:peptidoglycan/LPS O-acetylase OafA/YrhL
MKKDDTRHVGTLGDTPIATDHVVYRADIDGLRAIAVLSVLAFHAFPKSLPGGFIGVDIFFVISGYLISKVILTTIAEHRFSITDFYARRVRRIFPALVIVLAVCLVFGWHVMLAEDLRDLGKHTLGGAGFVANLVLWKEAGYFDAASETKPLLHLWSLGIEEQFYLVWPLLLWAGSKLRIPLWLIILVTGLISFGLDITTVHHDATAAFYSPLTRAWELMVGGLLAYFYSVTKTIPAPHMPLALGPNGWARAALANLGLALIVYGLLRINSHRPFPGSWALVPTIGAALLIGTGPSTWLAKHFLASRPMVIVGLISYPLYLWHWPLLVGARTLWPDGPSTPMIFSMLALSFVLAWLTYRFVERPIRTGRPRPKVIALTTTMMLVAGLGGWTWVQGGFPSRYPEIVQRATEYDLDGWRAAMRHKRCFMELGQDARQFSPECVDPGNEPLWLLWGDSGAAAMYAGLRAVANDSGTIRLAQFTSSACPPIVGFTGSGNPACTMNNDWIIRKIADVRPAVVVLEAMWQEYDRAKLASTIQDIRATGVKRVIVLGPAPAWTDTPSRITFKLWREDAMHRVPPAHLNYDKYGMGYPEFKAGGSDLRTATAETDLARVANDSGAEFISITKRMCDPSGCLMRASESSGAPFYLDLVHLTPDGSRYAARAVAPDLGLPPHH